MNAKKEIDVKDPVVQFNVRQKLKPDDLLALITYEGSIGSHLPEEVHVDTQEKKISVLFNNGHHEDIVDIDQDNIDLINYFLKNRAEQKIETPVEVAFYRVDEDAQPQADGCYNVTAVVI